MLAPANQSGYLRINGALSGALTRVFDSEVGENKTLLWPHLTKARSEKEPNCFQVLLHSRTKLENIDKNTKMSSI